MTDLILLLSGAVLGVGSTVLVLALCRALAQREPERETDWHDREYEQWRVRRQAQAEMERQ